MKCSLSNLAKREPEGHLFNQVSNASIHTLPSVYPVHVCKLYIHILNVQLLERLKFYAGFEINDQSGSSLTDHEMTDIHYKRCTYTVVKCTCQPIVLFYVAITVNVLVVMYMCTYLDHSFSPLQVFLPSLPHFATGSSHCNVQHSNCFLIFVNLLSAMWPLWTPSLPSSLTSVDSSQFNIVHCTYHISLNDFKK